MSDRRLVQCFGTKRRPRKADQACRRRYIWTGVGTGKHHFGSTGAHACPHCGSLPEHGHPYNRYLNGELTFEEAEAAMPGFIEKIEKERDGK